MQPCVVVYRHTGDRGGDKIEGCVEAVALSDETAERGPYCRSCAV